MTDWHTVATVADFNDKPCHVLEVEDVSIAVFLHENEYFAVANACTHAGMPLANAPIIDNAVMCPYHGARFCIKTGKALCPPAFNSVKTYSVKLENGVVKVAV